MVYRYIVLLSALIVSFGCAAASTRAQHMYTESYKTAVKEQIDAISGEFQSGIFPYYHWSAPIVQELNVPAHIHNGMFIPAHQELVMIKPGQWAKGSAYPISEQKEQYVQFKENDHFSTVTDITSVPKSMGRFDNSKP